MSYIGSVSCPIGSVLTNKKILKKDYSVKEDLYNLRIWPTLNQEVKVTIKSGSLNDFGEVSIVPINQQFYSKSKKTLRYYTNNDYYFDLPITFPRCVTNSFIKRKDQDIPYIFFYINPVWIVSYDKDSVSLTKD